MRTFFDQGADAHAEWLGYVQPVGVVVSSAALLEAGVLLNRDCVPLHRRFLAAREVDADPLALFTDVLGWRREDLAAPEPSLTIPVPGYDDLLCPEYTVQFTETKLLISRTDELDLDADRPAERHCWNVSPQLRFERLLRETGNPIGRRSLNVVPIRFVRACRQGHIGDIDWYQFVHGGDAACQRQGRQLFLDQRGTSGDLAEISVRCTCGAQRNLAQIGLEKAAVFGLCDGARPWLGPAMRERCSETNRLLVRTASNAYFPQRMSVISLPERDATVREAVSAA